jgi:hypothetical protein
MHHVTSNDGTAIAFEKIGQGPALVIVGGVLGGPHAAGGTGPTARVRLHRLQY